MNKDKLSIERERIASQRAVADKNLEIARENKNQYELKNQKGGKDK